MSDTEILEQLQNMLHETAKLARAASVLANALQYTGPRRAAMLAEAKRLFELHAEAVTGIGMRIG